MVLQIKTVGVTPSIPQDSLKPLKGSNAATISTWEVEAGELP